MWRRRRRFVPGRVCFWNDETLRDGLQNPSVFDPSIEEKIEILHLRWKTWGLIP